MHFIFFSNYQITLSSEQLRLNLDISLCMTMLCLPTQSHRTTCGCPGDAKIKVAILFKKIV